MNQSTYEVWHKPNGNEVRINTNPANLEKAKSLGWTSTEPEEDPDSTESEEDGS